MLTINHYWNRIDCSGSDCSSSIGHPPTDHSQPSIAIIYFTAIMIGFIILIIYHNIYNGDNGINDKYYLFLFNLKFPCIQLRSRTKILCASGARPADNLATAFNF